jgi:hypothetical protein
VLKYRLSWAFTPDFRMSGGIPALVSQQSINDLYISNPTNNNKNRNNLGNYA